MIGKIASISFVLVTLVLLVPFLISVLFKKGASVVVSNNPWRDATKMVRPVTAIADIKSYAVLAKSTSVNLWACEDADSIKAVMANAVATRVAHPYSIEGSFYMEDTCTGEGLDERDTLNPNEVLS